MSTGADLPTHVPRRRLIAYYLILAAVTAIVIPIEIAAGSGKHAQPGIAGGYVVSAGTACLGPTAQVMQSGSFVTISDWSAAVSLPGPTVWAFPGVPSGLQVASGGALGIIVNGPELNHE